MHNNRCCVKKFKAEIPPEHSLVERLYLVSQSKKSLLSMRMSNNTMFGFRSLCPQVPLWLVKMWDKQWEFGAGDPGSELPGGQFTQRPVDRGHFKHSALMATEAAGFANVSHTITPLVQPWLPHCVTLPPGWAWTRLSRSNYAWIAVQW